MRRNPTVHEELRALFITAHTSYDRISKSTKIPKQWIDEFFQEYREISLDEMSVIKNFLLAEIRQKALSQIAVDGGYRCVGLPQIKLHPEKCAVGNTAIVSGESVVKVKNQ